MSVEARKPITASLRNERHVTRCNGSSGGISVPVRSAICSRRAFRSSLLVVQRLARVALERGRLQERQDLGEALVRRGHRRRRVTRTVGIGSERRRREQLGMVGVQRARGRRDVSGAEVGERRRAIGPHDQASARPPARARCRARGDRRGPATHRGGGRGRSRSHRASRACGRSHRARGAASPWWVSPASSTGSTATPPRSAASVRNASCSTCWSRPARDPFRAPMPDRVPGGRHELAVLGVAAEHLDHERPALRRRREGEGHAPRLQGGISRRGRVDAELPEHLGDLVEGEPPAR